MKQLLLLGAGHAHAQVLRTWAAAPVAGCELVIVSPSALAPYSGMVPGWLAGSYRFDAICINVAALAQAAGARLVIDSVARLDADRRQVHLASGAVLGYDLLSLNVGSTLNPPAVLHTATDPAGQARSRLLSMRPLGGLHNAWTTLLDDPVLRSGTAPLTVTAVGGGAAGVESLLAVLARLRALQPRRQWQDLRGKLLTRSPTLLPGMAPGAVRAATTALAKAGAQVLTNTGFNPDQDGSGGLLLWATGAEAHAWQRSSGLGVSERGFIRINAQLQSISHPQVFAVGDCADWATPLPKAGIYAVRMGHGLTHNLRAALGASPAALMDYQPQQRFLALLATADGSAVASWGPLSAQGRWVLRWKDKIDRRFLQQFKL